MATVTLPIRMRIGDSDEQEVGTIELGVRGVDATLDEGQVRLALADLLREVITELERPVGDRG